MKSTKMCIYRFIYYSLLHAKLFKPFLSDIKRCVSYIFKLYQHICCMHCQTHLLISDNHLVTQGINNKSVMMLHNFPNKRLREIELFLITTDLFHMILSIFWPKKSRCFAAIFYNIEKRVILCVLLPLWWLKVTLFGFSPKISLFQTLFLVWIILILTLIWGVCVSYWRNSH